MNVLKDLIQYLAGKLDVQVSTEVPAHRPDSFVTVQREGGGASKVDQSPTFTVQVWNRDRLALEDLAESVETAILQSPDHIVGVFSAEVLTESYYPLQVGETFPRYVLTCALYCRR